MPPEVATDDFSAAFDRLAELGETKADATSDVVLVPDTPVIDSEPDTLAPETPEAPEVPAEAATTEAPATDTAEPEPQEQLSDEELLERFAKMVKQTPTQPEPQPQQVQAEAPDIYSADEKTFLQEYEKDWPDVAKAEALRRRAEYRDLVGYIFREISREFAPLADSVKTIAERTHLTDIYAKVEDYDNVRDNVVAWAEKQPTYLQAAYKHVIQNGTADEIADLVSRYKKETGVVQAAPVTSKKESELPPAAKQAAASLAPVSSKRSAVIQGTDPNDFEGAFEQFAAKM